MKGEGRPFGVPSAFANAAETNQGPTESPVSVSPRENAADAVLRDGHEQGDATTGSGQHTYGAAPHVQSRSCVSCDSSGRVSGSSCFRGEGRAQAPQNQEPLGQLPIQSSERKTMMH